LVNCFTVLILEIKISDNWRKDHQIILEKIIAYAELPDNIEIQKKKFSLLTELFLKLRTNKNYVSNFRNISSLILILLNLYKKSYPVDIFSTEMSKNPETKSNILEFKRILKQELQKSRLLL